MRHANMDAEAMDDLAVAVFRQKLRSLATYTFRTAQLLLKQPYLRVFGHDRRCV